MNSHRFLLQQVILYCFFATVTVYGQNKYEKSTQSVIEKELEGKPVYSNLSLIENLSKIDNFSIYSKMLELVDFENLIKDEEMVTVFVVPNSAFSHMTDEELDEFLVLSNLEQLKTLVSNYVIPGRVDKHALLKAIESGNGSAKFRTLNLKNLLVTYENSSVYLLSEQGIKNKLLQTNFHHSKGFFHLSSGLALSKSQN
ncbi:fasciclin domain-containing protein [uncultured Planktosalinus sp.]|uniref:fasciclin domain-containing protein n=1 Tax=uncultured Planktosalinus sp. TaxID=1810935 RepID=UPI0030DD6379